MENQNNIKQAGNLYFAKITADYWTAKNNLHKEILREIKEFDNTLMDEDGKKAFLTVIMNRMDELNERHPRCKPYKFNRTTYTQEAYGVSGVFEMQIYPVKHRELD